MSQLVGLYTTLWVALRSKTFSNAQGKVADPLWMIAALLRSRLPEPGREVPVDRMALWSWRDLERRVCGEPTVDLALLKKHAHYENVEADAPRVRCAALDKGTAKPQEELYTNNPKVPRALSEHTKPSKTP